MHYFSSHLAWLCLISLLFLIVEVETVEDGEILSEKSRTSYLVAGIITAAALFYYKTRSSNRRTCLDSKFLKDREMERNQLRKNLNQKPFVAKNIVGENVEDGSKYDVIIVGAGIAGCALGKALSDQGRNVLIVERDLAEPDRIVGELLQPGGVAKLKELGMEECIHDIDGQPDFGYAVYPSPEDGIVLEFPYYGNPKQPYGISFHHGRFIQNLREAAQKAGAHLTEGTVSELLKDGTRIIGVSVTSKKTSQPIKLYSPLTVVVDGCFSNFRKELCDQPSTYSTSKFYGLVLSTEPPNRGYGHVILTHPGVVLAYAIGTGETRVLIDVVNDEVPENMSIKDYMMQHFYPKLPPVLRKPFQEALEREKLKSMPCTTLHPTPMKYSGVLILGDAWNMRHPLTGGGMTVAFSDTLLVAKLLRDVKDLSEKSVLDRVMKQLYEKRLGVSRPINMLAYALYCVLRGADRKSVV